MTDEKKDFYQTSFIQLLLQDHNSLVFCHIVHPTYKSKLVPSYNGRKVYAAESRTLRRLNGVHLQHLYNNCFSFGYFIGSYENLSRGN